MTTPIQFDPHELGTALLDWLAGQPDPTFRIPGDAMTAPNPATNPAAWWDNLIDLHPPQHPGVAAVMDDIRDAFKRLGHVVIEITPPGPDQTVALRALKDAAQASIANIACHQEHYA